MAVVTALNLAPYSLLCPSLLSHLNLPCPHGAQHMPPASCYNNCPHFFFFLVTWNWKRPGLKKRFRMARTTREVWNGICVHEHSHLCFLEPVCEWLAGCLCTTRLEECMFETNSLLWQPNISKGNEFGDWCGHNVISGGKGFLQLCYRSELGLAQGNEGCAGEDRSCPDLLSGCLFIMLFGSAKMKFYTLSSI